MCLLSALGDGSVVNSTSSSVGDLPGVSQEGPALNSIVWGRNTCSQLCSGGIKVAVLSIYGAVRVQLP